MRRQVNGVSLHLDRFVLHIGNVCTWIETPPDLIYDVFLRIIVPSNSFEQ